jgi:uncharacterized protein YraI
VLDIAGAGARMRDWGSKLVCAMGAALAAITIAVGVAGLTAADLAHAQNNTEQRFVSATSLNVRMGPGLNELVIARLSFGERVSVHQRLDTWARIEARQGAVSGWAAARYLSEDAPARPVLSDARIRALVIEESLSSYYGSCPCPYNIDRAGRRCGRRSAYSRPGGASPLCYPSDVSSLQVQAYRRRAER